MGTFTLKTDSLTVAFQENTLVATKNKQYIYSTDTATNQDAVYLLFITSYPPVGGTMPFGAAITGLNSVMACTSIQVSAVSESASQVFTIDVQGSTMTAISSGGTPFVGYTSSVSGTYVDVWREVSPPQGGTVVTNADITGAKLDSGGKPISKFVVQSNVQVTKRVTTVPWTTIWGAVGKRNLTSYDGAAVGQLLFTGISVNTVGVGVYEISFQYLSDALLHCRQLVILEEADGRPMNSSNQAKDVRWVQPHPLLVEFSTVFAGT